MDAIILNMFEINYSRLIQYEILEKLVTYIILACNTLLHFFHASQMWALNLCSSNFEIRTLVQTSTGLVKNQSSKI